MPHVFPGVLRVHRPLGIPEKWSWSGVKTTQGLCVAKELPKLSFFFFFGSLFLSYRRQLSLKGTISPRRIRRASEEAFRSSQLLPKSRDQQQFADTQKYFSNRVQMRLPLYLPRFQFRPSRFPCENSWHKQLAQQEARFLKLL